MPQDRKTRRISTLAAGFTLIELLVTLVIISILASLSLAGMVGARQRSKIDKTNSTIRKLHEIVIPQYESYLSRRVTTAGIPTPSRTQCSTCYKPSDPDNAPSMTYMVNAWKRLIATRRLMVQEMPDQWADVYWLEDANSNGLLDAGEDVNGNGVLDPPTTATAATRRYAAYKTVLAQSTITSWSANSSKYEGAECLAMLITRGGFEPDAMEAFRTDEMGDIDKDGAPEFWDGWGRPIGFIRWPAGFLSAVQPQDSTANPDPFDPMLACAVVTYPTAPTPITQRDYGLIPLIYSPGPDESTNDPLVGASGYGLSGGPTSWLLLSAITTTRPGTPPNPAGSISDITAAQDNITNHDLMTK